MEVLVTGGAGFIGSHLVDLLIRAGHEVRVLDNLEPQVHGSNGRPPSYLNRKTELIIGDIRSPKAVRQALDNIDAVVHLASRVGIGQSMSEIADYMDANSRGTAVLLESMVERAQKKLFDRLVVASSMSLYGEGLYATIEGWPVYDAKRTQVNIRRGIWDPLSATGKQLTPVPTPETKAPELTSVYALSKYDQERLCLVTGRAYEIPTVALRFFNVYGPRQSLSNPYPGVLAIFASRLLNDRRPLIFEDGEQRRDFVHVSDIARACYLALKSEHGIGEVFNIGSGQSRTIRSIAEDLASVMGLTNLEPEITREFRIGDIRHCFADITKAREVLDFNPKVRFQDGLRETVEWIESQTAVDRVELARNALASRGLIS